MNCGIYFYFHFFNMSETARRIKILVGMYKKEIRTVADVNRFYNYDEALNVRLDRLVQLSQLQKVDNSRYVVDNRLFYVISLVIMSFRRLLGVS
ncbi:MAG: hypothetical protein V1647_00610 [Pseudomonadota bacterium]